MNHDSADYPAGCIRHTTGANNFNLNMTNSKTHTNLKPVCKVSPDDQSECNKSLCNTLLRNNVLKNWAVETSETTDKCIGCPKRGYKMPTTKRFIIGPNTNGEWSELDPMHDNLMAIYDMIKHT